VWVGEDRLAVAARLTGNLFVSKLPFPARLSDERALWQEPDDSPFVLDFKPAPTGGATGVGAKSYRR